MDILLSVILCTYNPRSEYLRRVLDALHEQTLPTEKWELLIVDNASQRRVEDDWDISWHAHGRHVREDTVGLTNARLCGIRESAGHLLVFVDDDNILAPGFLEHAARIPSDYPFVGVFGAGVLQPEFEIPPPPELASRVGILAIRTVPLVMWSNNVEDFSCIPWGAGLCATREVAIGFQELIGRFNATSVIGRKGKDLFSGEDDVFSWAAVKAGKGFGLFPELHITHLISTGRLTRGYFLRLLRDHAFSHGVLRYLRAAILPRKIGATGYVRLLLHGIRNGRFSMQCLWSAAKGEAGAARFIAENGLTSMNQLSSIQESPELPPFV